VENAQEVRGGKVRLSFLLPLILLAGCGTDLKNAAQHQPLTPVQLPVNGPAAPVSPAPTPSPTPPSTPSPTAITASPHVILIIEENRSFSTVYPVGMPWLSALGDAQGIATNYYSDEPGSMEDYLWLSSGSGEHVFGCAGWGCSYTITSDNIFRELNRAGLSWKVYAESLPWAGFMGSSSGYYVKRHNPAAWYSDVVNSTTQQKKMVPFTQLAKDLAANVLPNYSIIIPNVMHDAHTGTMAMADAWLKQNLPMVLNSAYFRIGGNGVMFITFDNGDGDAQGHVFTAVVGPNIIPKLKISLSFRHEDTLRTMMQILGLKTFPGASATAAAMTEFIK
jgi:phosphatidylinositol-3-phosphatase